MKRRGFLGALATLVGLKLAALEPGVDDVCGWCMAPFDSAEHRRCRPWNCACDKVEPYGLSGIILCEPCGEAQWDRQCREARREMNVRHRSIEWFRERYPS